MARMKQRAVVAMGGGPTRVINRTLYGILAECGRHGIEVLAARHGIDGVLRADLLTLKAGSALIRKSRHLPGACIGSTRTRPKPEDCDKALQVFADNKVGIFFYVGGNDTAEASGLIHEAAQRRGYDLRVFHVPKTIDNDLVENDHCPGYGSAARYVAHAILGDDLDVRSIPGAKVDVIMGRDAGWLAASASLCRTSEEDGPHLIFFPERPKTLAEIMNSIIEVYRKYGRAVVAVAEGLRGTDNELFLNSPALRKEIESGPFQPIAGYLRAMEEAEKATGGAKLDQFGHAQLSGTGALADFLAAAVKVAFKVNGIKGGRVRADTFGYPQRSYAGDVSPSDAAEAEMVGREAVRLAAQGAKSTSIALRAERNGGQYRAFAQAVPLSLVAGRVRPLADEYINPAGNFVSQAFYDYARPLVGKLMRQ